MSPFLKKIKKWWMKMNIIMIMNQMKAIFLAQVMIKIQKKEDNKDNLTKTNLEEEQEIQKIKVINNIITLIIKKLFKMKRQMNQYMILKLNAS